MTALPYRFRDDIATADVAFDAWGADLASLFAAAADALLRTMVERPETVARSREVALSLEGAELDLLLLAFLQEFVFEKDANRLLLHPGEVRVDGADGSWRVTATAAGEEIDPRRHPMRVDVKAVTLHRLRVAHEDGAWRATVVLDV